jgi:hypothetical protein
MGTVDEAKARLAPGKLAADAAQTAKNKSIVAADGAVGAVKDRPGLAAGIVTATALFIARKPLFSAVLRLFGRGSNKRQTTTNTQKTERSRTRGRGMEDIDG